MVIADLLARCDGLGGIFDALCSDEALSALGASGVAIYLYDAEQRLLSLGRQRDLDQHPAPGVISIDSAEPIARAAREETTVIGRDRLSVALPLSHRRGLVGAIELRFSHPCACAWRELGDMAALARFAAAAVTAVRSFAAEAELRYKLQVLDAAGRAVAEALSILPEPHLRAAVTREFKLWPNLRDESLPDFLRGVLQTIVEHAVKVTGARFGALGIGDDPSRPFSPWVVTGIAPELAAAIGRHPRPVGTLGVVACGGEVVSTANLKAHPAFIGFPPHHPDVTSLLGVPIRYRGAHLGNLYLGDKLGAARFSDEDRQAVELLAAQAAISLQQAYLRGAMDVQRSQLRIMLDSAAYAVLFVDAHSDRVIANPRAMEILGRSLSPEGGRAQYAAAILGDNEQPLPFSRLPSSRALAGEEVRGEPHVIVQPSGRRVPVLVSAAAVPGPGRELAGAVVSFEDISGLRQESRLREQFAAVMAHDLRDPIQAILMQVEALRRHRQGDEVRGPWAPIEAIAQSARRLGQMTSDLLDATRIELGRLALERRPVELGELVRAACDRLAPRLSEHPIALDVAAPSLAHVDPARIEQLIESLLDNAAKFSPGGAPIAVRVGPHGDGAAIEIADRGVGIDPADLPRLFDRFYQSARVRENKTGLGLGLYLVKGLVEAHGGSIAVRSERGQGTTFRIWLPARVPS